MMDWRLTWAWTQARASFVSALSIHTPFDPSWLLHEDLDLLVVNKPAYVASQSATQGEDDLASRLLAWLMALQAGLPPLDFSAMQGRGKRNYIAAIHAAFTGSYEPMERVYATVIRRTSQAYASGPQA